MLDLGRAVFPIKDAKLLTDSGNCTGCMKRAGNQPEVYEGIHPNVCTDPDCFAEKTAAHYLRLAAQARKAGMPVFEGDDATQQYGDIYRAGSEFVSPETQLYTFERIKAGAGMHGTVSSRLPTEKRPSVAAYIKEHGGVLMSLYNRAEVQLAFEAHGICESAEAKQERQSAVSAEARGEQHHALEQRESDTSAPSIDARAAEISAVRVALYRSVRPFLAGELPLVVMHTITKLLLRHAALPHDLLGDLYPHEDQSEDGVRAYIDSADHGEVQQLLCDLLIGDTLRAHHSDIDAAETDTGSMTLHAMAVALSKGQQAAEQDDASKQVTAQIESQQPARPVLKLRAKAPTEQKPTEGPLIKVKKSRTIPGTSVA